MNSEQARITAAIPMFDLLDLACAAQAAIELEKITDKEHAFKHVLHRVYGYMTPAARLEFQEYVDRKGWRPKETIILP